jgi:hypothetical protein
MADIKADLKSRLTALIASIIADPKVPAQSAAVAPIVDGLDVILQQILHSTNNEPWYTSRVTLGALLGIVGTVLLAFFNIDFNADAQKMALDLIVAALPVAGGLLTLYGRWKAKVPIGIPLTPVTAPQPPPAANSDTKDTPSA